MKQHALVGIGGIDESRMPQVLQSGVGSVAVVRAITGSDAPEAAVQRLQKILRDFQKP
jgi:thiamine-phosphate pyrophosphorylase